MRGSAECLLDSEVRVVNRLDTETEHTHTCLTFRTQTCQKALREEEP